MTHNYTVMTGAEAAAIAKALKGRAAVVFAMEFEAYGQVEEYYAYLAIMEADEAPTCPDQQAEWRPGCETWAIPLAGGQRGEMTVWPAEGRGAVMWGADSHWGDWDPVNRVLTLDGGERIDADGMPVE